MTSTRVSFSSHVIGVLYVHAFVEVFLTEWIWFMMGLRGYNALFLEKRIWKVSKILSVKLYAELSIFIEILCRDFSFKTYTSKNFKAISQFYSSVKNKNPHPNFIPIRCTRSKYDILLGSINFHLRLRMATGRK